jgi:hypothetical protein
MGDDEPDDPVLSAQEEAKDEDLSAAIEAIRESFGQVKPVDLSATGGKGGAPKKKRGGFGMAKFNVPPRAPGPAPKKLSCVLFADNTHVLLTGDASGRVDVYRLMGLTGAEDGSGAPAVGSEAHEVQLESIRTVIASL